MNSLGMSAVGGRFLGHGMGFVDLWGGAAVEEVVAKSSALAAVRFWRLV